jgi:hypothetical protein
MVDFQIQLILFHNQLTEVQLMASIIQIRRDTATNWTSANTILAQGELGIETDTLKVKAGDGTTAWASLGYLINTGGYAAYTDTTANFTGTLQNSGSNVLVDTDIGSTVQAYDATIVVDADIGSTVQGYDADTTKNDVANTFTAAQTFGAGVVEKKVAMAAHAIDLSLGNYFTYTLSGAQTLTVSNVASSGSVSAFVLEVTNGGSAALTFFSGVTWAAATAPTLTAAGVDTLAFFTTDGGTTWRGFVLGLGMA